MDEEDGELFAQALASRNNRPSAMSSETDENGNVVYRTTSNQSSAEPIGSKSNPSIATESLITREDLQELCRWVPLRLSKEERRLLLLLEGALQISEYTDNVDVARNNFGYGHGRGYSGEDALLHEMREFCRLVIGLYASTNLRDIADDIEARHDPFEFRDLLRRVFEVGRRYKIQNPTKMRTTYGKLMHILMDAVQPSMAREIGANMYTPTHSVYSLLAPYEEAAQAFLTDADLLPAASPIDAGRGIQHFVDGATRKKTHAGFSNGGPEGPDVDLVEQAAHNQALRREKHEAIERLFRRHAQNEDGSGGKIPKEIVQRCLDSIDDALAFLSVSTASVEAMIDLLLHFFDPHDDGGGARNKSLQLRYGSGGSRLSHSHSQQFKFVLQTLLLWKQIIRDMYKLWHLTDADLIGSGGHYVLRNTGQGMNRVQSAPKLQGAMSRILSKVKGEVRRAVCAIPACSSQT